MYSPRACPRRAAQREVKDGALRKLVFARGDAHILPGCLLVEIRLRRLWFRVYSNRSRVMDLIDAICHSYSFINEYPNYNSNKVLQLFKII